MAKTMDILVSPFVKKDKKVVNEKIGQIVEYINVFSDSRPLDPEHDKNDFYALMTNYDTTENQNVIALLNYQDYHNSSSGIDRRYREWEGYVPAKSSTQDISAVFKQEITKDGTELTPLITVDSEIQNFKFRDFNVSNDRTYKYVLYPLDKKTASGAAPASYEKRVAYVQIPCCQNGQFAIDETKENETTYQPIHWDGWSITELHPVQGNSKKYTATADDVWLFNLNVQTGEQTQNINRANQQTLGQFDKYSQGRQNFVSGSVSCLLGSQVVPANYVLKTLSGEQKQYQTSGYQEVRIFNQDITSNERVDMLLAWRKLVRSNNPKLLKDREGQSFLVTITNSGNTPMDNVKRQPNTLSFSWVQIGTTDDLQIVDVNMI